MKQYIKRHKETLIYVALWLILFMAPVLSLYIRYESGLNHEFRWSDIFVVWKAFSVYVIVFLIHNFFLAPLLIYKKKKTVYFSLVATLIFVFAIEQCYIRPSHRGDFMPPRHERPMNQTNDEARQTPPDIVNDGQSPDKDMTPLPPKGVDEEGRGHRMGGPEPPLFFGERPIVGVVMMLLMLGFNLAIKLFFKAEKDNDELEMLEKQNLEQQLEYLKYQINPHFFMNTLNNIHALVDIDPEKAKETIVELSKMMRHLLYEGNTTLIPLQQEINFLHHYIKLMSLRYNNKVKINVDIPQAIPDKSIPPLVLITFVENAFKHGVSYQNDSLINIKMSFEDNRFLFVCQNSKHEKSKKERGGVGLPNVRKRLELIYKDDFRLDISDGIELYEVKLDMPLA